MQRSADDVWSVAHVQRQMKKKSDLIVPRSLVAKVLRQKFNMSYRRIKRTAYLVNTEASLVKRCAYAKVFLPLLRSGKRIINIDESSIPYLDFRNHKWGVRG